ncbi:MAG: response regulator transcription factor [Clostridia bacterium]|nr:response regulator transcription factor [Clostridia bacterium]
MIYLVEDDNNIRELILYTLQNSSLEAAGFATPSAFWKAMEQTCPSLILLDIMLPEEDGLSILKRLRGNADTQQVPVILLTARDSEYDKVLGLDSGADDYITKPFGMMELLARIKAQLRRAKPKSKEQTYCLDGLSVFPARRVVCVDGNPVSLTYKEFELLCYLLQNRAVVLTRDRLLDAVWGYEFDGENRTVDVHIRTLRQKLGPAGHLIETVRGVGYKIGGPVHGQ